jgi:predicted transcriptional regulator
LIDVDSNLDLRINEIVHSKGYQDFQHFASIALENQVLAEVENQNSWTIRENGVVNSSRSPHNESLALRPTSDCKLLDPPTEDRLVENFLWGQYSRYLPIKLVVRVLSNLSVDYFPPYSEFVEAATSAAYTVRKTLSRLDNRKRDHFGDKVSAGFPDGTEESIRRFRDHFLITWRRGNSKLDGMLARLKFANIVEIDGEPRVGLTDFGRQFAVSYNNVLDDNKLPPLSDEETSYLLKHIFRNMPTEAEHLSIMLNLIKSDNNTRDALNITLKEFYGNLTAEANWSDNVVNTMRAGMIGRLQEMGLIERHKSGKFVTYSITEQGDSIASVSISSEEV